MGTLTLTPLERRVLHALDRLGGFVDLEQLAAELPGDDPFAIESTASALVRRSLANHHHSLASGTSWACNTIGAQALTGRARRSSYRPQRTR